MKGMEDNRRESTSPGRKPDLAEVVGRLYWRCHCLIGPFPQSKFDQLTYNPLKLNKINFGSYYEQFKAHKNEFQAKIEISL